jgi:Cell division protein FtsI/penicillin-binding protein 2
MSLNREKKFSRIILVIILTLYALIAIKGLIVVITSKKWAKDYDDPVVASQVVRGNITDTEGNILAVEIPVYNLVFMQKEIPSLNDAASLVAPYVGLSPAEILKICDRYVNYTVIKRHITAELVPQLKNDIESAGLANSILIEKVEGRTYPASFHASQIIGFTDNSNHGLEGIEYKYDDLLSPYPGYNESVTHGNQVTLTLDLDIQYLMDIQVQNIIKNESPDYVMAMITNAENGDILAATSWPWFDLNNFQTSTEEQRYNRISGYNYEPGSVFKVFTLASAMEAGIDTETPFYCDGEEIFNVNGQKFVISCHEAHGEVSAKEMISKSCNGAIAKWVLQLEPEYFVNFLKNLSFGTYPESGMTGESKGVLNPISSWSNRSQATIAFGQEIAVNALQIMNAASAVANDGIRVKPHILKEIIDPQGNVVYEESIEKTYVMSAETAQKIRSYMSEATKSGTATLANVPGVDIASKTGTSQIINSETNSYEDGTVLASTLALVPSDKPKYIIYFAVANPKENIWGANVASPAVAAIVNGMIGQGKIESSIQKKVSL